MPDHTSSAPTLDTRRHHTSDADTGISSPTQSPTGISPSSETSDFPAETDDDDASIVDPRGPISRRLSAPLTRTSSGRSEGPAMYWKRAAFRTDTSGRKSWLFRPEEVSAPARARCGLSSDRDMVLVRPVDFIQHMGKYDKKRQQWDRWISPETAGYLVERTFADQCDGRGAQHVFPEHELGMLLNLSEMTDDKAVAAVNTVLSRVTSDNGTTSSAGCVVWHDDGTELSPTAYVPMLRPACPKH